MGWCKTASKVAARAALVVVLLGSLSAPFALAQHGDGGAAQALAVKAEEAEEAASLFTGEQTKAANAKAIAVAELEAAQQDMAEATTPEAVAAAKAAHAGAINGVAAAAAIYDKAAAAALAANDELAALEAKQAAQAAATATAEAEAAAATEWEEEEDAEDDPKASAEPALEPEAAAPASNPTAKAAPEPDANADANAALYADAFAVARWSSKHDAGKYYKRIKAAALAGHPEAQISLAYAQLFGNATEQVMHDIPAARDTFIALAEQGHPQAQHVVGFLYSMGIGVDSDQAKALVHLTFAALGGDTFSQMALGYRYHVGSGVAASCETSLSFYRTAAARVESEVVLTGGEVIERVRLSDEVRARKIYAKLHLDKYYRPACSALKPPLALAGARF